MNQVENQYNGNGPTTDPNEDFFAIVWVSFRMMYCCYSEAELRTRLDLVTDEADVSVMRTSDRYRYGIKQNVK